MPHLLGQAPLRVKRVKPVRHLRVTRPHAIGPEVVDCRQAAAAVHLAHRLAAVVQEVRARPRRVLLPCPLPVPLGSPPSGCCPTGSNGLLGRSCRSLGSCRRVAAI